MSNKANTAPSKVLRIGLFQNNRIIEERLLRTPKAVTIGSALKKNTFVVPASNLPKNLTVFEVRNGKYVLHISKGMTGRVKIGTRIETLQDLVQKGRAVRAGAEYTLELAQNAQGRIAVGEATLLFQFVTPPAARPRPVLPASMRGGWLQAMGMILTTALAISAFVHISPLVLILNMDFPEALEADAVISDRFVNLLVDKKEPEPEPEPEPELPKDSVSTERVETEPVKKPVKKPKVVEKKEDKPLSADEIAKKESARKKALAAEVQNKTILGQIGSLGGEGGSLRDVLSGGAGKTSMDKAFADSTGITSGKAGAEKSGLRSSGASGADGKAGAVGIGELGGTSASKAAKAGVKTGTKKAAKIKARVNIKGPTKTIGGTLDANKIAKILKRKTANLQRCYERMLKKDNKARGKVVVMFVIGQRGRVTSSKATTDSVGGGTGACVASVIKGLRFPPPKGGPATVSKAFVFDAGR